MSTLLNLFNLQYEVAVVQQTMPVQLRVSGNLWFCQDYFLETWWRAAKVDAIITPAMTSAQCDTLAQTMLAQIKATYPNV